jgi:hypothetical protein
MGTTTQRGYGWSHQKARAKALDDLVDGEPCPFCGEAMAGDMDLDYDHYPPLAMGGTPDGPRRLAHSSCNRRAGQAISARRRARHTTAEVVNSRAW